MAVWEVFRGKIDRLLRMRDAPESDIEFEICPQCWRKMEVDHDTWEIHCPDPICNYRKRMPGLSPAQNKIKAEYNELKEEIFQMTSDGKDVPAEKFNTFRKLQEEYKAFSRYDPDRKRERNEYSG